MTTIDAAWLAGIVDGEGHVDVKRNRVEVTNCDIRLLRRVKLVAKCGRVRKLPPPRSPLHRQAFRWSVTSKRDVRLTLTPIQRFLITKRVKSRKVLETVNV
jgi:hypothetical protein